MFFSLVFILLCFPALYSKRTNWFLIGCLAVFFILFAALRPSGMDPDYDHYLELYKDPHYFENGIESVFVFLALISPSLTILLLVYATIGVTLKFEAIRRMSPYPWLSLLIYYSHYYFLQEVTQIRAGVSCGFILISLYYYCNKRMKFAWVYMALAIVFHYSAIFACLFLFINRERPRFKLYLILFIISLAKFISGYSVIQSITSVPVGLVQERLSRYQYTNSLGTYDGINMMNTALWGQMIVALLSFYMLRNHKNQYIVVLAKVYAIGLISYMFLAEIPAMSFRISEMCFVVEFILLPMLINLSKSPQKGKTILAMYSCMLFVLYQLILKTVNFYPF